MRTLLVLHVPPHARLRDCKIWCEQLAREGKKNAVVVLPPEYAGHAVRNICVHDGSASLLPLAFSVLLLVVGVVLAVVLP